MTNLFTTVLTKQFGCLFVVESFGERVVEHIAAVLDTNEKFGRFDVEGLGLPMAMVASKKFMLESSRLSGAAALSTSGSARTLTGTGR
jgi:hypothetical protein